MDNKNKIYGWLLSFAKKYWLGIFILTLLSLLKVGFQLLNPWPIKILIDSVFGDVPAPGPLANFGSSEQLLIVLAIGLVVLYLLQNLLTIFNAYLSSALDMKLDIDIKSSVFHRLMNMSFAILSQKSLGDYIHRLNSETSSVRGIITGVSRSLMEAVLMISGALIVLFYLNPQLTLFAVLVLPFLFMTVKHFSNRIESMSEEIEVNSAAIYSHTTDSIKNIRMIQTFDKEPRQSSILQSLLLQRYKINLRNLLLHGKFGLANDMITTVAMSGIVLIGGFSVLQQELTIGELIIFLSYISFLFGPLETVNSTLGRAREYMASTKRVYEIANTQQLIAEPNNPVHIDRASGYINFVDASFSYHNNAPILRNVQLNVDPGQKIVITGPSGSGKSTLLNLLPRFYDLDSGSAYIDGKDVKSLGLADLRRQFGIVSQQPMLIAGSIGENIAFGSSDPSTKADSIEVISAAQAAGIDKFIRGLPQGYRTVVGEKGVQLSGGQKQRISIARAFLKNAPILLLDEPTSSLDYESEYAIVRTLQDLMASRTSLIVTHSKILLESYDVAFLLKDATLTPLNNPAEYFTTLPSVPPEKNLYTDVFRELM